MRFYLNISSSEEKAAKKLGAELDDQKRNGIMMTMKQIEN